VERARAVQDTEEVSGPGALAEAAADLVVAERAEQILADLAVQVAAGRQVHRRGMVRWVQEWNPERAEQADGRMRQAEFGAAGRRAQVRARWRWKPA
jgi:hypothetical protein